MTETCGIVSLENPQEGSRHSGSGEIWVRGANMMQGRV